MASGKVHNADAKKVLLLNLSVGTPVYYIATGFSIGFCMVAALVCGMLTFLVNPDLDVNNPIRSQNILKKRFPLLGKLNIFFWKPYALIFKHRSFWSHFPIVSTLIRIYYILDRFIVLGFFYLLATNQLDSVLYYFNRINWSLLIFLLPLFINDVLHWKRDNFKTSKPF